MYQRQDLYQAFWSGASKSMVDNFPVFLQTDPLGDMVLVDGEILLADPYIINRGLKIRADGIPSGHYAVDLYSEIDPHHGDRLHLGMGIRFTSFPAKTFRMVLPDEVSPNQVEEGSFYGLRTESGNLSIMTGRTCHWLLNHPDDYDQVLEAIEAGVSASYSDLGGVANTTLPHMEANLITAVVRGEPGVYPSYWVLDDEDKLAGLIVDFTAPNP